MPADRPDADELAADAWWLRSNHDSGGHCVTCEELAPCRVIRLLDAYEAASAEVGRERDRADKWEVAAKIAREEWETIAGELTRAVDEAATLRAALEAERGEVGRLREAVDQLARLAGPGYTTAEALGIIERLRATEGTDGG